MFDAIIAKVVLGMVRHVVTGIGGWLLSQSLVTQQQDDSFIGAIMVIVPIVFSIYDKWHAKQTADEKILAATKTGVVK